MARLRMNVLIGACLVLSIGCDDSNRSTPASHTHPEDMDAGALSGRARSQGSPPASDPPSPTNRSRDASTPELDAAGDDSLGTVVVLPDPGDLDYAQTTVTLGSDGVSQWLRFDVPSDAWSFVATASAADPTIKISLQSLVGPDGRLFPANPSASDSEQYDKNLAASEPGMPYAIMVPNRPELAFSRGTYEIAWRAFESLTEPAAVGTELTVDVVFRRSKAEPTGGKIDLLFLIGSNALFDAKAAATDQDLQDSLRHAATLLSMAGISIGNVTYEDVNRAVYEDDAGTLETMPVSAMLSERASEAPGAIRVIWLDDYFTAGEAMGAPGAPGRPGLARVSPGVIDLPSVHGWLTERMGLTLAHELGHLLGLAHTTEQDWSQDHLLDTPECTIDQVSHRDAAGAPLLDEGDCVGHGVENVMFWKSFDSVRFEQLKFSPDQSWVMRRNPFVR